MNRFMFAAAVAAIASAWSSAPAMTPRPAADPDDQNNQTAFVDEVRYSGKVYEGRQPVAWLVLVVETGRLRVSGGQISTLPPADLNKLPDPQAEKSATVQVSDTGEIFMTGFPFAEGNTPPADRDPPKAVLQFDAKGKPAKDAPKLSGTITSPDGKVLKFEVAAPNR